MVTSDSLFVSYVVLVVILSSINILYFVRVWKYLNRLDRDADKMLAIIKDMERIVKDMRKRVR